MLQLCGVRPARLRARSGPASRKIAKIVGPLPTRWQFVATCTHRSATEWARGGTSMSSTVTKLIATLSMLALTGLGCSSEISGNESTASSDEALKGGIPASENGKGRGPKDAGDRDGDVDEDVDED